MIQIEHVSFFYESESAFQHGISDVSLSIKKGEFIVLAGGSGSGKTTVTRLLNGLIPDCYSGKYTGTVRICNKNPQQEKTVSMSQLVGSVFQNPKSQFFNINSRNELAFPLENRGIPREDILRKLNETAEKLQMKHLIDRNMFHLSGGEKQKIAFASVAMSDQPVLVLDEPSSNLDREAIKDLRKILEYWKQKGKTVIISEHQYFFLKDLIDRFVILEHGKIKKIYTKNELKLLSPEVLHEMGLRSFMSAQNQLRMQDEKSPNGFLKIDAMQFQYKDSCHGIELHDMTFHRGHVVAVIGHNGAGKSTFIRCLCGLEKKCKGNVYLYSQKISLKKLADHCTMVMQDVNHQLFTDSVENELLCEIKKINIPAGTRSKLLSEHLETFHLSSVRDLHPMAISGGQKQRLAIAAASLSEKEIIFFDEPTSGLDYAHMKQISKIITKLAAKNKLIFLVSHDVDLLFSCCDDVLLIEDGMVQDYYPLNKKNQERLTAWFQ